MADRLADLVLRITADSKQLQAELRKVESGNARTTKRIQSDWKAVSGGLSSVAGMLGRITTLGGLIGGISFAGLQALAADAEESASQIDDLSKRLGISTTALQQYQFAARAAGIDQGAFQGSLQKFGKAIGEAALGVGKARTSLEALGVSVRDSSGEARSIESVFEDVVRSLGRVENAATRTAIAQRIFGKSGAAVAALSLEFAEQIDTARDLGIALEDDVVAGLASAQDASEALSAVLDQRLSKALAGISGITLGAKKSFVGFIETLTNAAEAIGVFEALQGFVPPEAVNDVRTLDRRIQATTESLAKLNAQLEKLQQPLGPRQSSSTNLDQRLAVIESIRDAQRELTALERQRTTLANEKAPIEDPIKIDADALDTSKAKAASRAAAAEAKAAAREVEAAQQRLNTVIEASFTPAERLTAAMDQLGLDYREGKISADGFAAGQESIVRQFDELDEKIQSSALREVDQIIAAGLTPAERLIEQLDQIGVLYQEGSISAEKFAAAQESLEKQLAEVDADALKDSLKELQTVGDGVFEGLTGALSDFVLTGKSDFASLTRSFASEFLQFGIKGAAKGIFGGLFGGAFGGFLADGGPAMPGRPYVVGERGPELFVPKSAGFVVPNVSGGRPAAGAGAVMQAAPAPVYVTVNNSSRSDVGVREKSGPGGQREIEVLVTDMIARDIGRGGPVGRAIDGRLGVRPRGV